MGAMQNNPPNKRKKKKASRRQPKEQADWNKANAENIYYLITTVQQFDGAVRFGRSRDGGAYSIGVYGDGDPWTDYHPGTADVNQWLREITDQLTDETPGDANALADNA